MDDAARRVLETVAVFRRPIAVEGIIYVLAKLQLSIDIMSVVRRLRRTNMLTAERGSRIVTLHPIDSDYAYSQIPTEDDVHSRYMMHYHAAQYFLSIAIPEDEWNSIDDITAELYAFDQLIRAEHYDDAMTLIQQVDMKYLLHLWGWYDLCIEYHNQLTPYLQTEKSRLYNLRTIATAYRMSGRYHQADSYFLRALALSRPMSERINHSFTLLEYALSLAS